MLCLDVSEGRQPVPEAGGGGRRGSIRVWRGERDSVLRQGQLHSEK